MNGSDEIQYQHQQRNLAFQHFLTATYMLPRDFFNKPDNLKIPASPWGE